MPLFSTSIALRMQLWAHFISGDHTKRYIGGTVKGFELRPLQSSGQYWTGGFIILPFLLINCIKLQLMHMYLMYSCKRPNAAQLWMWALEALPFPRVVELMDYHLWQPFPACSPFLFTGTRAGASCAKVRGIPCRNIFNYCFDREQVQRALQPPRIRSSLSPAIKKDTKMR